MLPKDWLTYEEDGKVRAIELPHDGTDHLILELAEECSAIILGMVSAAYEKDAINYTEQVMV